MIPDAEYHGPPDFDDLPWEKIILKDQTLWVSGGERIESNNLAPPAIFNFWVRGKKGGFPYLVNLIETGNPEEYLVLGCTCQMTGLASECIHAKTAIASKRG